MLAIHTFWQCTALRKFWDIYQLIDISGVPITGTVELSLLHTDINKLAPLCRMVVTLILPITTLHIAKQWKQVQPYLFYDIISELNSHCMMVAIKNVPYRQFLAAWNEWLSNSSCSLKP